MKFYTKHSKTVLILFTTFLILMVFPLFGQDPHQQHRHDPQKKDGQNHHGHHHDHEAMAKLRILSDHEHPNLVGSWSTVIPEAGGGAIGQSLGMQTVHTILLPSGKILMSSGSSWRNLEPMEYYPTFQNPAPGMGLFNKERDPFHEDNLPEYYQLVNNTSIYDPENNTFFRIHSPYPIKDKNHKDHFIPNDFFCTGHIHLPNGNPFFVGGTQYYFPYRTGTTTSYIFDWRKELDINWKSVDWRQNPKNENYPWIFSGLMERGRWYPSLVPLLDGRFAIFSGYVGFDKGYLPMYQFELNHFVEFFDSRAFDPLNLEAAWEVIDVKKLPNSPFNTPLEWPFSQLPICYDAEFFPSFRLDTSDEGFKPPCDCPDRCIEALKYDAFKLYPHNYLLEENKIYLSREGEWVSLRTPLTEHMRRTRYTYWMEFNNTEQGTKLTFSRGPNRRDTITSYGTSFLDPNSGNLTILGGQEASSGTLLPLGAKEPNHFVGGRGSRKIEQFHLNANRGEGDWTEEDNFLGIHPQDDRTQHFAIILPTRQILIINGANYDFYGAVLYPLLLTPQFENGKFTHYTKKRMAEAVEPRLYHNSAMLLPDGKIFVSGGNSSRATVRTERLPPVNPLYDGQVLPNPDLVDLDLYFLTDGQMAKKAKGAHITPTENWTAEFFSPPYLFIDGERRVEIQSLNTKHDPNIEFSKEIGNKKFYLLQSNKHYHLELGGLPNNPFEGKHSLVLLKLPSVTHGQQWGQHFIEMPIDKHDGNTIHFNTPDAKKELIPPGFYMLYYVDRLGKPSVAQMVRFDDEAKAPF